MGSSVNRKLLFTSAFLCLGILSATTAQGSISASYDLKYEFDGNSLATSFGTVELEEVAGGIDVTITANTANLHGGDIHNWYFNVADRLSGLSANDFVLSDFGGISNMAIGEFTMLGPDPSVAGGAGAEFDWGVGFGNGGGAKGNGTLVEATFHLTTTLGLYVTDFLSAPFAQPNNTPATQMAVHFQDTDIFNADSETVGGVLVNPEPASMVIWLTIGGCAVAVGRRRMQRRAA